MQQQRWPVLCPMNQSGDRMMPSAAKSIYWGLSLFSSYFCEMAHALGRPVSPTIFTSSCTYAQDKAKQGTGGVATPNAKQSVRLQKAEKRVRTYEQRASEGGRARPGMPRAMQGLEFRV